MMSSLIPLGASLLALLFAVQLGRQYAERRQVSQLWWAVSMLSYAGASFGEFYALAMGWNVGMYKFYYFNAVALVGLMSAGQMYMLFSKYRAAAHAYLAVMLAAMIAFAVLLAGVEPSAGVLATNDAAIGGEALEKGSVIRSVFPPLLSGVGGLVLIVGPLWSWSKSRRSAPLFIAAGALILSLAGRVAVLGYPQYLPLAELIGIAVIYFGVRGAQGARLR